VRTPSRDELSAARAWLIQAAAPEWWGPLLPEQVRLLLRRAAGPDPRLVRQVAQVVVLRTEMRLAAEQHQREVREISTDLDRARRKLERARATVAARIAEETDGLRRQLERVQRLTLELIEPGPMEDCVKTRLRTREEARLFARRVERETGAEEGDLIVYRCTRCPRQVALQAGEQPSRFWHVGNADPAERTGGAQPKRRAAVARRYQQATYQRVGNADSDGVLARILAEQYASDDDG
jgi:hypothetical protein